MSTNLFTSRLPSASRVLSRKAPISRTSSLPKTANMLAATTTFQFNPGSRIVSESTIRSFSTQFREDYDDWYSHGCTGWETQSDEGVLIFDESNNHNDIITYGVQPVSELQVEGVEYDLEDQDVDYSDEEFESLFAAPSIDSAIVSPENMEYHPKNDESKQQ